MHAALWGQKISIVTNAGHVTSVKVWVSGPISSIE
jgi:hypothetical protein